MTAVYLEHDEAISPVPEERARMKESKSKIGVERLAPVAA